ncbi:von Willebrand factor A domain-containing protein 7 [Takifugu flavidus]|uniref:von Willebrand factor A domain-containing protein 7 n=1 Tax=Takifugu flavidus TaxID=433684 RepID=A0A5C6P6H7_9TELE|nr:von Willebrand factor A domain-containing protein 7 [Takifugu flavidus]
MSSGSAAIVLLLLCAGADGFGIVPSDSLNHQEITERAILDRTVEVCRALALAEGTDFTAPQQPYTAGAVAVACGVPKSTKSFRKAITLIMLNNVKIDLRFAFNGSYHFDEEMFAQGRKIITDGIMAVKASNKEGNYEAAREKLGAIFHPLQDFYSHSNWVELGKKSPNANLLRTDTSIGNIAAKSRATCRNCDGDDCSRNILEDILKENVLTSGYFGVVPLVSTKPKGKCSHGGAVDQTSLIEPKGGINKDTLESNHGFLHNDAANLAIAATSELLEDIRMAAGDRPFLEMLGISKRSSRALGFLIDTTKSMSDDIEAVRNATNAIVDSEVGTENEPSVYILVPFNDPEFGPLIKTTDPEVFKGLFKTLSASGGGDNQELSLSALQLALANAPANSEMFLFTDAAAKDKYLKNTVIALIERTQTVVRTPTVNFMISGSSEANRRKRRHAQLQSKITGSDAQLYKELARASGGQAIEVATADLAAAIGLVTRLSSSASLVTLLQAVRDPGLDTNFTFVVDETVTNLTVYITGQSLSYTITSPSGESQQSNDTAGSLITAAASVGNYINVQLKSQAGQWSVKIMSTNPYTLRVIGESTLDFLFDFVEMSQGPLEAFAALETRPRSGVNVSLLLTVSGNDSITLTEVSLVKLLGSEEMDGVVKPQESGSFLVEFEAPPSAEFVVRVKGQRDGATTKASANFQRVTSTSFRASNLTITGVMTPGTPFSVPFSVKSYVLEGNFTVRATNSRLFDATYPTSLNLTAGGSANGTVTITAPVNTTSGTDVTLTIEVEAPGGQDTNYAVLRFSVIKPVTDVTPPVCQLISRHATCPKNCNSSRWTLSLRVSDEAGGTGVANVTLKTGNGTLDTTYGDITLVSYNASCCAPKVVLRVTDRAGNEGTCSYSLSSRIMPSLWVSLVTLVLGLLIKR